VASRGVICASAGNHAQGVALAAQKRGIPAVIVMPVTAPAIKVQAVAALGGEVVLHGDVFDAAYEHAMKLAAERQLVFVHPFDDPDVIAGQGTVGMEIVRQSPGDIDAIFVAVGGGGLIGGIAAYVKSLFPRTKIIGVEPEDAASMHASLMAGKRVTLERVGSFADAVAVKRVGEETFNLARKYVDEIVLVSTDEMCAAIQDTFEDTRVVPEPAGALSIAGLKKYVAREKWQGKRLVAINCGANVNFDRLRYIAERAEIGAGREALLAVELPEQPGSFLAFCHHLGERNITEFNYREQGKERAQIFVGLNLTRGASERTELLKALGDAGYPVIDMTDNEMAKLHVRYMIGGQAAGLADECLFRFEFPERPGALLRFLTAVGSRWNISLFHYRNHGSDYGRVLAGIQVPPAERDELRLHLAELHYPYVEETANPAYRVFLGR
jgi:threonine dehydratase